MTRDKLLKIMINTFVSCMNPGYPISIRNIAHLEKETYYQVRKYMKQLEQEGLVKKESIYYPGDYNYEYGCYESEGFLITGWVITDKCRELKEYKIASEEEIKLIESCFGK
ncbi:MAG: FaeA/PapI family transcriptional regulator [Clostridia bacterium]